MKIKKDQFQDEKSKLQLENVVEDKLKDMERFKRERFIRDLRIDVLRLLEEVGSSNAHLNQFEKFVKRLMRAYE